MDMRLTPFQHGLVETARRLAEERFAPRADAIDRSAAFPFDDYDDLREAGLLALCVPEAHGGLGADFETYCLVAEQIARGNASTALTYNMHCLTMMMMGEMADRFEMPDDKRARHERLRAAKFREVVEHGVFYGQPHSEPVEQGETDAAFGVGGRRFGTEARKVDSGYRVTGRKFFVSLSGAADYFATPAMLVDDSDMPWLERTLYLQVPRDAAGVSFEGDWDPIGMRGTVSREMRLEDVFVPDSAEILPPGVFGGLYVAASHGPMTFSATFVGIMVEACETALAYLRGSLKGAPGRSGVAPATSHAVAEMVFTVEATRSLFYHAASEAKLPPTPETRRRARAAHATVQRNVVAVTSEAMRICGGRAILKRFPLERHLRDARAAPVMRPWTQDIVTQTVWEAALLPDETPTG